VTSRRSLVGVALLVVTAGLLIATAVVATTSFGGTGDTPCGSVLRRNFGFEGRCGPYYRMEITGIASLLGVSAAATCVAVAVRRSPPRGSNQAGEPEP
jgi:hypothetical protein